MDVDCLVRWRWVLAAQSDRMAAPSKGTGGRARHTRIPIFEYRGEAKL